MTTPEGEDHPEFPGMLPEPLRQMKRYLLWKERPHPKKPGKMTKVPFYVNGRQRQGILDTEADLAQLVTLQEALDEMLLNSYTGVGFALAGDDIGAFDLDYILDADGDLITSHAGYHLAVKAKAMGAYMEISPSGLGIRIVGPCTSTTAFSQNGLEFWGAKRFVTLTGNVWANPGGWVDLDELRKPLAYERKGAPKPDDDGEGEIITPKTLATLKSALEAIPSDERELWVRMGQALKTIGPKGYELWIEWSAKSYKFEKDYAVQKWIGFGANHTNHRAVFKEAQDNWSWDNPAKKSTKPKTAFDDEPDDDAPPEKSAPSAIPLDLGRLHPTEYIIDGFLPVGVSVVAGAWGAGKSVNLVPLLASAAHLSPEDWGFHPILRRKVIWVSEAPEQARDTLYSLSKAEGAAPPDEFDQWFHLFRAVRQEPKRLAKSLHKMIDEHTYSLDNGFEVKPVIVLDTTSANIDLENESDNSMVSQAMAILKQSLPGISIVLVGHTPKALVKADVKDMTFRGAGAWEADSVATYFLIYDQETETRYLAIRKCRFIPEFSEIDFGNESGSQIIDTPWGEAQSKHYLHGVPTKSDGSSRKKAQAEAKQERDEEKREATVTERQSRIMEVVLAKMETVHLVTKGQIFSWIGGKKELTYGAVDRLVERGTLVTHEIDRKYFHPNLKGPTPEIYLPEGVEVDLYLEALIERRKGDGSEKSGYFNFPDGFPE